MATALNVERATELSALSPLELLRNNIETERLEEIPLSSIQTEASIIDESHAIELANNMSGKRGQLSAIVVRAREEDGKIVYDVIDGFHRTAAKKMMGEDMIKANVAYSCSDEELFDLRILAASSVQTVQFPRIAEWISRSYQTTQWMNTGLTVAQVFALAMNDSNTTRNANLPPETVKEIKKWVQEKSKSWGRSAASIYQILRVVEDADPSLVRQVRNQGGGKDRATAITPQRLEAVVAKFPGEVNYPIQNAILQFVQDNRLSAAETATLVDSITLLTKGLVNESNIKGVLAKINVRELIRVTKKGQEEKEVPKGTDESTSDRDSNQSQNGIYEPTDHELTILEEQLGSASKDHRTVLEENGVRHSSGEIIYAQKIGQGEGGSSYDQRKTNEELLEENASLKKALEIASGGILHDNPDGKKNVDRQEYWWQTAPYLSSNERYAMETLFSKALDISEIADSLHILPMQVLSLIQSACARRREYLIHHAERFKAQNED